MVHHELLNTILLIAVKKLVFGSRVAASLGQTKGFVPVDDEAVQETAPVQYIGDIDSGLESVSNAVAGCQGPAVGFTIQGDPFIGRLTDGVFAGNILGEAESEPAGRSNTGTRFSGQAEDLHQRALID